MKYEIQRPHIIVNAFGKEVARYEHYSEALAFVAHEEKKRPVNEFWKQNSITVRDDFYEFLVDNQDKLREILEEIGNEY